MPYYSLDDEEISKISAVPWFVRMWASVLRRAIVDWVLYREHTDVKLKRIGFTAEVWLFGPDEDNGVNSFSEICDVMGIPVDFIRGRIRALTEEQARRLRGMEFGDEW